MKRQPYNLRTDQFDKMVQFYGEKLKLNPGQGLEGCFDDCGCSIMIQRLEEEEERGDLQRITLLFTADLGEVAEGLESRGVSVKNRDGIRYLWDPDCNEIVLSAVPT